VIQQFNENKVPEIKPDLELNQDDKTELNDSYIKDIAAILVVQLGIDVNYVMNEMEISDIKMYYDAYLNKIKYEENKQNIQLAYNRMNAWWTVVAQIGNKDFKTPSKLYSFPWEEEQNKKEIEAQHIDKSQFNSIMKNQMKQLIDNVNNQQVNK